MTAACLRIRGLILMSPPWISSTFKPLMMQSNWSHWSATLLRLIYVTRTFQYQIILLIIRLLDSNRPSLGTYPPPLCMTLAFVLGGGNLLAFFIVRHKSVRRMMCCKGFTGIIVYLDDFLVVSPTQEGCEWAFTTLRQLLLDLGFQISPPKVVPPASNLPSWALFLTHGPWSFPYPKTNLLKQRCLSILLSIVNVLLSASYSN